MILANLGTIADDLESGAVVVLTDRRSGFAGCRYSCDPEVLGRMGAVASIGRSY